MDDVDAVQAQIARNMLVSGDWVSARLNDVPYLEKAPLIYWTMAVSFRIFGVHDWAARLPLALSVILLCWVVSNFGTWAFDETTGLIAGLVMATCTGLFLFTRILIPDAMLTLCVTCAVWSVLRMLEPDGASAPRWAGILGLSLGLGLLLKGLIAVVFTVLATVFYLALTRQVSWRLAWRRLHPLPTGLIVLTVAAPWHILATLRNPPYFAFSLHSGPGEYHGFFWFYFINEHLLRFLNLRYPRDYNTVPRLWFWLLSLIWLFPWSPYLAAAKDLKFNRATRAGRVRGMAVCWIAAVMVFFTFSTSQEYYSLPMYPALAMLIACCVSSQGVWARRAHRMLAGIFSLLAALLSAVLVFVWRLPSTGDVSQALTQNPERYTLSLGHISDLTLGAFAYLKLPLALAAVAFAAGALGLLVAKTRLLHSLLAIAVAMVIFFQAAHLALVKFDSYLGSYPLAQALQQSPPGCLIEADAYYAFSSVFFYTGRTAWLWNGRINNLEYGSYAPGVPPRFIDDSQFAKLWNGGERCYLLTYPTEMARVERLAGRGRLHVIASNSGNLLLSNRELP